MTHDEVWEERRSGARRHPADARTSDELDYARVVHAGSFRRLQGKTQILSLGDDDFYRTRLTHSLEVAQVAEGIVQHLRSAPEEFQNFIPSSPLIRALGLAHDLGHPPFGHGGELALNYCMRGNGGFEGNAQTLRLLTRLEAYSPDHGADLTRRTLLGLLKYPALRKQAINSAIVPTLAAGATTIATVDPETCKPVKACYDCEEDVFEWILAPFSAADRVALGAIRAQPAKHGKTVHKSFDCSIMDTADDIAYGIHDLEDAAALNLISPADVAEYVRAELCGELLDGLKDRPVPGVEPTLDGVIDALFGTAGRRKRMIGRLVHHCLAATSISEVEGFEHDLLRYTLSMRAEPKALLQALRDLISTKVIQAPRVQHLDFKGQRMVVACFEALSTAPQSLLPDTTYHAYQ